MDVTPPNSQARISLTFVILTSLAWFVFPSVDAWVAFSPIWIGIVVWQIHRRTRWAMFSLLAPAFVVVPVFCFLMGALGYITGTARIQTFGLMRGESFNITRQWRCRVQSFSCGGSMHDDFTDAPNNYAIELLTRWFGYMPGAYSGPYPRREQAFESIAMSVAVAGAHEFDGSTWAVYGTEIVLTGSLLSELQQRGMDSKTYRLSLYRDECLLVADSFPAHSVFLVDLEREDVFAKYLHAPEGFMERRLLELFRK